MGGNKKYLEWFVLVMQQNLIILIFSKDRKKFGRVEVLEKNIITNQFCEENVTINIRIVQLLFLDMICQTETH